MDTTIVEDTKVVFVNLSIWNVSVLKFNYALCIWNCHLWNNFNNIHTIECCTYHINILALSHSCVSCLYRLFLFVALSILLGHRGYEHKYQWYTHDMVYVCAFGSKSPLKLMLLSVLFSFNHIKSKRIISNASNVGIRLKTNNRLSLVQRECIEDNSKLFSKSSRSLCRFEDGMTAI